MAVPGFELFWLKGNPDVSGRQGRTILDSLVNPPANAVAAQAASRQQITDRGEDITPSVDYTVTRYENRDFIREAHDKTGILH